MISIVQQKDLLMQKCSRCSWRQPIIRLSVLFLLSYSDLNMFEMGNHWPPSHCPLYLGLTPSEALLTTAYWKFLRTDPRQGSCYEWVVFLCNPSSCDLTSCLSQSLSNVDESFPPTTPWYESIYMVSSSGTGIRHPSENNLFFLFFFPLCFIFTSCDAPCSYSP